MGDAPAGDVRRALSLSRSRSKGRKTPGEVLARRQQLLSGSKSSAWLASSDAGDNNDDDEDNLDASVCSATNKSDLRAGEHRRPSTRRANRISPTSTTASSSSSHLINSNNTSGQIDSKLDNLSELLISHQHEAAKMQQQAVAASLTNSVDQPPNSADDLYILLAKKERDLQLAAELGKALLEKNEELSKANERITEDYSCKLEILEEQKHKLKRKLDLLDGEYENRLIELQTDCNIYKNQLADAQQLSKKAEKEKSKLIDDLMQQNQRLTSELIEATKSEELLSKQLEQLSERFDARLSSRQDQTSQVDALKEEINIVNQRKQDLERRLKLANKDKENLSSLLEESGDKLLLMENELNESVTQLTNTCRDLNELKDTNNWLMNEFDEIIQMNDRFAGAFMNELQNSSSSVSPSELVNKIFDQNQTKRSQLVEQLKELRRKQRSNFIVSEFMHLSSKQKQKAKVEVTARQRRRFTNDASSSSPDLDEDEISDDDVDSQCEIFAMLRKFQLDLQHRKDALLSATTHLKYVNSTSNQDDSGISADEADKLGALAKTQSRDAREWLELLSSIKALIDEMPCSTCQLMIAERADYEQLRKWHVKLKDELKFKSDELLVAASRLVELETQLEITQQKCCVLSEDLKNCDNYSNSEQLVKLAWKVRDEALERKNQVQISLAKTRIEVMQISSQLMEAVQQKAELSQKLAQFEDDIHSITQDSVKAKFTWEEYAERMRRSQQQKQNSASQNSTISALLSQLNKSLGAGSQAADADNINKAVGNNNNSATCNGNNSNNGNGQLNLRNFASTTTTKFNLKFWQRNSTATQQSTDSNKQQQSAGSTTATALATNSTTSTTTITNSTTTTNTATPTLHSNLPQTPNPQFQSIDLNSGDIHRAAA